ncbi:MAG TPA: response regulator [Rhodanobacteraceae bacterium]|nr:response regulator [Rhodanobacteraceae bacterium]
MTETLASAQIDPVDILLVDDQPARLLAYKAILAPLAENLIEASSGAEALKHLMERECALILLDVNMPGMDGFETASMIHQHPRFEKTPIIFVTAINVSDMDRMRGYKLGAVDYVTVPIIPEILRSKVVVLAELYRKRRDLQLANQRLEQANEALRAEKARELSRLNESLRLANNELGTRNNELQAQIAERVSAELRLLEVNRRKDEFLATLAHELRNPLAALGNALNALQLAERVDPLHEAMLRQLKLLVRLIDDLLDIARINRGKLTVQRTATTLRSVLDSAIETATPLLLADRHALDVRMPAGEVALYADHDRLSQVFSNLLNNAAKYSASGSPIALTASSDGNDVEIVVTDSGIGLAPGKTDEIFEAFAQIDTSVERSRGGLGIGLTLVKRIVELHGGRIQAHSEGLGQGSRFTVALPLEPIPAGVSSPAPVHSTTSVRCRALIVDDNRDSADTLAMMLQMLGHDTECIYDPRQTNEAVSAFDPDIVFLDIGMPGLSGYDVARGLRAAGGPQVTLVAVTGWGHAEDRRRTAEAGFDHHLVKPADMAAINAICNGLTPHTRSRV